MQKEDVRFVITVNIQDTAESGNVGGVGRAVGAGHISAEQLKTLTADQMAEALRTAYAAAQADVLGLLTKAATA